MRVTRRDILKQALGFGALAAMPSALLALATSKKTTTGMTIDGVPLVPGDRIIIRTYACTGILIIRSDLRVVDVASGLPFGLHTVRYTMNNGKISNIFVDDAKVAESVRELGIYKMVAG